MIQRIIVLVGSIKFSLEYMMNPVLTPEKCVDYKGNNILYSQDCKNPEEKKLINFVLYLVKIL